jgi:hypothetical protein
VIRKVRRIGISCCKKPGEPPRTRTVNRGQWSSEYRPDSNLWGLNEGGITSKLRCLEAKTGITCNPHTFRRTFAVLLRKADIEIR